MFREKQSQVLPVPENYNVTPIPRELLLYLVSCWRWRGLLYVSI
jgi:hypothetical protein